MKKVLFITTIAISFQNTFCTPDDINQRLADIIQWKEEVKKNTQQEREQRLADIRQWKEEVKNTREEMEDVKNLAKNKSQQNVTRSHKGNLVMIGFMAVAFQLFCNAWK